MSAKNSRHNKRLRRFSKMVTVSPRAEIDLVQWLQTRGHANTAGKARKLIHDGRVRSESHTLGREGIDEIIVSGIPRLVGNPRVPAHLRSTLTVV